MTFYKGMPKPPGSGRKPGSKNKKRVAKVADLLAEKDINPVDQILNLIPSLDEEGQVNAWLDLLAYCQAKPKVDDSFDDDDDIDEFDDIPTEELLRIIKLPPDGVA